MPTIAIVIVVALIAVAVAVVVVAVRAVGNGTKAEKAQGSASDRSASVQKPSDRVNVQRKDAAYIEKVQPAVPSELPLHLSSELPTHLVAESLRRIRVMLDGVQTLEERRRQLEQLAADAEKPLLLVVMGQFKTGKSSFINALIGADVLKVDVTPATAAVTMLVYGDKHEVIGHMTDGSQESFPPERLHALSAEGDAEGERLRSVLNYLEVRLPADVLKKVAIVDTPGLNADNPLHTQATEFFMDRADQVLWVFPYAQAATNFDMSSIQNMRNDLKPIGIVNRIDEHDPEEMDLDAFLESVKRRAGQRISHLVGVSAYNASQARAANDGELWEESRWSRLEALLEREVYAQGERKKFVRVFARIHDWLTELLAEVTSKAEEYDKAYAYVHDNEAAVASLREQLKEAIAFRDAWDGYKEAALYRLGECFPIPVYVDGFVKLNGQIRMMQSVHEKLVEERKSLEREGRKLQSDIASHNALFSQLEEEFKEYSNSGMFGGTPLFDWDGKKKRLTARQNELNQQAEVLNGRAAQLDREEQAFHDRRMRNEKEAAELAGSTAEALRRAVEALDRQIDDNGDAKQQALERMDELDWAPILLGMLQRIGAWELGTTIAVIERRFGGDGRLPDGLDDVLRRIDAMKRGFEVESSEALAAASAEADVREGLPRLSGAQLREFVDGAADGGTVTLPEGVFRLEETLDIAKSLTLSGAGADRTVLSGRLETLLRLGGASSELRLSGIGFDLDGFEGCIVHATAGALFVDQCGFRGAEEADDEEDDGQIDYEETRGVAICADLEARLEVRRSLFEDNGCGILLHGRNEATIAGNTFANNQGGIFFVRSSDGLAQRNEFVGNDIGIVAIDDSQPTLKENRIWSNGAGVMLSGRAKPFLAYNELVNNAKAGAVLSDESFATFEGNAFRGNTHGIAAVKSGGAYAYGNLFESNVWDGIGGETEGYILAEGNRLVWNGRHGVSAYAAGEVALSRNRIENNFDNGVYGNSGSWHIADNTISHNRHMGVGFEGVASSVVERNEIWFNAHGVYAAGTAQAHLTENDMMSRLSGVTFDEKAQGTAERNRCRRSAIGMRAIDEAQVRWVANKVEENKEYGIYFDDRATGHLDSNECLGNGSFGIAVASAGRVDADGNRCDGNEYAGIAYVGDATGTVSGNRCEANGAGIRIVGRANVEVVRNECNANRNEGIGVQDAAQSKVKGNRCARNEDDGLLVLNNASVHAEKNEMRENAGCGMYFGGETTGAAVDNNANSNGAFGLYLEAGTRVRLKNNGASFNKIGQIKDAETAASNS